ncbi:MAG: AAA family ATPase [Blastocatellia bacterium]|nr:AAA family ATPase [Blastocatellia bacterium]
MSRKSPNPPGNLTDIRFGKDVGEEELFSYPRFEELRTMLRLSVVQRAFSLVTGKAGIGKTTAVRSFTSELAGSRYQVIYFGQDQNGTGLLKRFALLLGLQPRYLRHQVAMQISQALADNASQGGREVVAVVDEAHLLDAETLEDIRLLSNSNFDTSSALSIILLGQQQLRAHLKDPRLEALNQRLTYRFFLEGFTSAETAAYIKHRVETAGGSADVFTDDAIHRIFDASEGVPREINNLCSLALLKAQTNGAEEVDGKLVKQLVSQRDLS